MVWTCGVPGRIRLHPISFKNSTAMSTMSPHTPPSSFAIARGNMIESQIRPNRVGDPRLLDIMLNLPRERFVPDALQGVAYSDEAVRIAPGRYLTEPLVLAQMFEALALRDSDHVLVVGTGSGYSSVIAAKLAGKVDSVEEDEALRSSAADRLREFGCGTVSLHDGRLSEGWEQAAPYSAMLVDGAVAAIPEPLIAQLTADGRLATVLRAPGAAPHVVIVERAGQGYATRPVFDGVAHLLPGFAPKQEFTFA